MTDTIELVRFRLREDKTADEWLKDNEKMNEWLRRQPGFRFRSLSETEDGEWIDVVHWESRQAAQAAAGHIMEDIGEAFGSIDVKSIVMSHSKSHVLLPGGEM